MFVHHFTVAVFLVTNSLGEISSNPRVETSLGIVEGKTEKSQSGKEVDVFLGIPFAVPPLGQLRFRRPEPAKPWEGILDAKEYGASCMQGRIDLIKFVPGLGHYALRSPKLSEDCLFLNVLVPKSRPTHGSVLIFLHGGALAHSSSSSPLYNGTELAADGDIILVTLNYRLTVFGFGYLKGEIQGNFGLMDQALAMKWVQDNIAAFGGDPNKVTIGGVSAGAISVGYHLVSPLSKGLFNKAVMQSGSALFERAVNPRKSVEEATKTLAEYLECPDLSNVTAIAMCLRSASAQDIINNRPIPEDNPQAFNAIVDGIFLPKHPYVMYKENKFSKVDILTGVTNNEGTVFMMIANPLIFNPLRNTTKPIYEDFLKGLNFFWKRVNVSDEEIMVVNKHYLNEADRESPEKLLESTDALVADILFRCGVIQTSKYLTGSGNKVYNYVYNHRPKKSPLARWAGVMHGSSVIPFFGVNRLPEAQILYDETDKILGDRMLRYWTNFIKNGDPNEPESENESISWPLSEADDLKFLVLAPGNRTVLHNYRENSCNVLNKFLKYHE